MSERTFSMLQTVYNLCDLGFDVYGEPGAFGAEIKKFRSSGVSIIYVGSYFCTNYYLRWVQRYWDSIKKEASEAGISISVVVPVAPVDLLSEVKESLMKMSEDIAEIVVNDYGMLRWAGEHLTCPVMMGRLFMRQTRDPRYEELADETVKIPFSLYSLENYRRRYRVKGIEMEGFGRKIDVSELPDGMVMCIHWPWIFMSCGRICEDASIPQGMEHKFRPDQKCSLQCGSIYRDYTISGAQVRKCGKAVYFYQEEEPELICLPQQSIRKLECIPYEPLYVEEYNENFDSFE